MSGNASVGISVVVANFNGARFLVPCIESIAGQSYDPLEIVVVDDASTDDSRALLQRMAATDSRLRLVLLDRNLGPAGARDVGIDVAHHDLISTLDSDDVYVTPTKLADEARALEERDDPSKHVAYGDVVFLSEDGHRRGIRRTPRDLDVSPMLTYLATRAGPIPRDLLFWKHQYAAIGGFDPSLRRYEDWHLKLRLARSYGWVHSGSIGVGYRQRPQGLSDIDRRTARSDMVSVFDRVLRDHPDYVELRARLLSNIDSSLLGRLRRRLRVWSVR